MHSLRRVPSRVEYTALSAHTYDVTLRNALAILDRYRFSVGHYFLVVACVVDRRAIPIDGQVGLKIAKRERLNGAACDIWIHA